MLCVKSCIDEHVYNVLLFFVLYWLVDFVISVICSLLRCRCVPLSRSTLVCVFVLTNYNLCIVTLSETTVL